MRTLIIFFVRRLKRDPKYTLDPAMTASAIFSMLFHTLGMALRGGRRRIGFKRAKGITFIGKRVTLRNKRYISVGRNFIADDGCEIDGLARNGVVFGNRATVGRYAMIRPSPQFGGGELGEGLSVGDNSNIGPYSYIGCSGHIRIGNNVMMSPRVSLYAENHNFADYTRPMKEQGVTRESIVIEDDCWIASHSVVLAGVRIGRGSIVAAGTVVTKSVPPYSIVAGSPGRVIRSRLPEGVTPEMLDGGALDHMLDPREAKALVGASDMPGMPGMPALPAMPQSPPRSQEGAPVLPAYPSSGYPPSGYATNYGADYGAGGHSEQHGEQRDPRW